MCEYIGMKVQITTVIVYMQNEMLRCLPSCNIQIPLSTMSDEILLFAVC